MSVTQQKTAVVSEADRLLWLRHNYGVLARVARELGYTGAMVGAVYWGKSPSKENRVEKRLAELGAPGFEQFAAKDEGASAA